MRKLILIFLFFIIAVNGNAQYLLKIFNQEDSAKIKIQPDRQFKDTAEINNYLKNKLKKDIDSGFIKAGFDSVIYKGKKIEAYYFKGNRYYADSIILKNSDLNIDNVFKKFTGRELSLFSMKRALKKRENLLKNNGFPFAQAKTDSLVFHNDSLVWWYVDIQKNSKYYFGGFKFTGFNNFPEKLLYIRSGIKKGEHYRADKVKDIEGLIDNLAFVELEKTATLFPDDSLYYIELNLKEKKSDIFSGNIGMLPGENNKGVSFTGMLKLGLFNSFGKAENIDIEWEAPDNKSQSLNISYSHPVIYERFGLDGSFDLEKTDSSYINISFRPAINYTSANSKTSLYYEYKETSVLNDNAEQIFADTKLSEVGISYEYSKLDYINNPSEGVRFLISAGGGSRIAENKENSFVGRSTVSADYYYPLSSSFSIHLQNESGAIFSENLYENEMFVTGNTGLLRAYKAYKYKSGRFTINSLELLFYPEKKSSVYLFFDSGIIGYQLENDIYYPVSTGAGVNVSTNVGKLSLSYGIGRTKESFLDLRQSNISIGYLNLF